MRLINTFLFSVILLLVPIRSISQRQTKLINNDWRFRHSYQVERGNGVRVDIPHTWNAKDALSGKIDYSRSIGNYTKTINVPETWKGKRIFRSEELRVGQEGKD